MNKTTLGIDPGKTGAACFLIDGGPVFVDWNDNLTMFWFALMSVHREYLPKIAILEKVSAMPKQGVTSTFSFGQNFGAWKGFLTALEIPYIERRPQDWQKGLITKKDGSDTKKRALNVACRLFPHCTDLLVGPKGGIKDGRVDALLMAYVARREL